MANCCDCTARIEYEQSGTQRDFTFPFEYYEQSEIKVSLYNKTNQEWEETTDWSLINPTTVRLNKGQFGRVAIYRCTDIDQARATFVPGTPIKAQSLNDNYDQLRNAIEEAKCCADTNADLIKDGYDLWLNRIDADTTDSETGVEGDLVKSSSRLTLDDDHVATTKWIDNRYWDQCDETTYQADNWFDEIDDVHIPTTAAVEQRLSDFQALTGVKKVTGPMQREQKWDESVTSDDYVATTDAIVERLDHDLGETSDVGSKWLQPGKIWIKSDTAELFYRRAEGTQWIQLDTKGDKGDKGDPGQDGVDAEFLTFVSPLVKTDTVVSLNLLSVPNLP